MNKCKCEHPVLIFNPNLVWLVSQCKHISTPNTWLHCEHGYYNMPWRDLYAMKDSVTPENIDEYYILNADGETFPLFMYVPCGKCRLCREAKVQDWMTRCMCETASSDYPPLFITLTYDNEHLPADGVSKRDIQLFMKRLRIAVARYLGDDDDKNRLRYFLISEYGKNTHRAHYHLLLWNMPFISPVLLEHSVELLKLQAIEGLVPSSFQALTKFIQNAWQNGFVKVERCRDMSGRYCMKYMRKDGFVPEGKNPVFMLASRRRGIGYKWCDEHMNEVKDSWTYLLIQDKFSGKVEKRPIPMYFKRFMFPTLSVLFPNKVTQACKTFMESATNLLHWCNGRFEAELRIPELIQAVSDVSVKYSLMHIDFDCAKPSKEVFTMIRNFEGDSVALEHLDECYIASDTRDGVATRKFTFLRWLVTQIHNVKDCYKILDSYTYSKDFVEAKLKITQAHKDWLSKYSIQEEPDIDALVAQYEIDRRWERTHWLEDKV